MQVPSIAAVSPRSSVAIAGRQAASNSSHPVSLRSTVAIAT
jgi:hypothetical protein